MMDYLGGWLQQLVLLILIATFMDLLIPNQNMKKYVKMVVGLLIIMVILTPVLDLFQFDHERMTQSLEDLLIPSSAVTHLNMDVDTRQMQQAQDETVLEHVAYHWAEDMKAHIYHRFDVETDIKVHLHLEDETAHLSEVYIQAMNIDANDRDENAQESNERVVVQPIQPVDPINISIESLPSSDHKQPLSSQDQDVSNKINSEQLEKRDKIIAYLAEEWNISEDKISFSWEGR